MPPNIGEDFVSIFMTNGIKLNVYDTAGQEKFRSITLSSLKNASALILVCDLNDPFALEGLQEKIEMIKKNPAVGSCPRLIVGNLDENQMQVISNNEMKKFAQKQGYKYSGVSINTPESCMEVFKILTNMISPGAVECAVECAIDKKLEVLRTNALGYLTFLQGGSPKNKYHYINQLPMELMKYIGFLVLNPISKSENGNFTIIEKIDTKINEIYKNQYIHYNSKKVSFGMANLGARSTESGGAECSESIPLTSQLCAQLNFMLGKKNANFKISGNVNLENPNEMEIYFNSADATNAFADILRDNKLVPSHTTTFSSLFANNNGKLCRKDDGSSLKLIGREYIDSIVSLMLGLEPAALYEEFSQFSNMNQGKKERSMLDSISKFF